MNLGGIIILIIVETLFDFNSKCVVLSMLVGCIEKDNLNFDIVKANILILQIFGINFQNTRFRIVSYIKCCFRWCLLLSLIIVLMSDIHSERFSLREVDIWAVAGCEI